MTENQRNDEPARRSSPAWRRIVSLVVGLGISSLFLWLTLHAVNLQSVWREVQSANCLMLVLATLVSVASTLIRAVRWRSMLADKRHVPLRPFYTSMMIGYLGNNILPARMGELLRVFVLGRKAGISKSTVAATIVLERFSDVALLFLLLSGLTLIVPVPAVLRRAVPALTALFAVGSLVLVLLALRGNVIARYLGGHRKGIVRSLQGVLERFSAGFQVLRSPQQALRAGLTTLLIWGSETASVWLILRALHLDVPWFAAVFVLAVVSLSFLLPAAPGAVGTYEFLAVAALVPFRVIEVQAVGLALVLHGLALIMSTILGLVCLWVEGLSWQEFLGRTVQREEV